jgi:hypothetical protein
MQFPLNIRRMATMPSFYLHHDTLPPFLHIHKIDSQYKRWGSTKSRGVPDAVNAEEPGEESSSTSTGNSDLGLPGSKTGGRKLAIIYTCTVCGTRSAKQFSEQAYKHGVVLAICPGCNNKHLIADNLSMFDDTKGGWSIEKAMADAGVQVITNDNVLELTLDDIVGKDNIQKIKKSSLEAEICKEEKEEESASTTKR